MLPARTLRTLAAAAATVGPLGCGPSRAAPGVPPEPLLRIDTTALRGHTRFLADDNLRGRATGSAGADQAALYIVSACVGLGLKPVGASYLQPVALLEEAILAGDTWLDLSGPGGAARFDYPTAFLPEPGFGPLAGFAGPAMLGRSSDDPVGPRAPPVRGSVAVVAGLLGRDADDSLRARGAGGVVQLIEDPARYDLYVRSWGRTRLRLADSTVSRSLTSALPSVVAGPALAGRILAGGDGARVARLADTIAVRIGVERRSVSSNNVGCRLEGTQEQARDSAIVYTAHYDHLGVGAPDARGDSIYNGFSDNAAGVAMLLGIAQAMSRPTARPRHSVLFLFFTGEEQGLLGSDYYVAYPTWPTDRMLGVINLDAGAPPGRPWSWRIAGGDDLPLGQLARDVAAEQGWSATTSPATPNSDYYPFTRTGVPAIFIIPGTAPYQGLSVDSTQALRRRWDRYHELSDEWSASFPFAGLGRYAEYAYYIGRALDDGRRERRPGPPGMP